VVGHACQTALALVASFSFSEAAFPGGAAETFGLWLGYDLLAAYTRLAAGRNLGFDPFRLAELAFA
jgi:hypothetical protein